jgi:NAD(P)-dependent dehydrogenase (short-subunit alcohol dehydrogenase family)
VALVTGAARGIGRAIAAALVAEGAAVALADRDERAAAAATAAITASGACAVALGCDVTDPASAERLDRDTVDALGGLHVLVNDAAIGTSCPAREMSPKVWDRMVATKTDDAIARYRELTDTDLGPCKRGRGRALTAAPCRRRDTLVRLIRATLKQARSACSDHRRCAGRCMRPRSRRGIPAGTSGRNAYPSGIHPINHHVADPEPTRIADRSKAGRPRAQNPLPLRRTHAPPTTRRDPPPGQPKRLTPARGDK